MSKENVENLRAAAGAWQMGPDGGPLLNRNTGERLDRSLFDPEVIFEDTNLPDHSGETYHGHEGVIRATDQWTDPFEEMTVDLERIGGTGDCLVSIHRWRAKARHTGIEFDQPLAYLWRFRNGKVIYFRGFRDPEEALEVAGLSQ